MAWDAGDLDGFVSLLKEDALLSMPPLREWYMGRAAIRNVFAGVWRNVQFRSVPTAANRQPALASYGRSRGSAEWRAHGIQLLTIRNDAVTVVTIFRDPRLFATFGLPTLLPG
jgi:RNA polymerase sigma-70 factor (ECF subfamily)